MFAFIFVFLILTDSVSSGQDFYELLGINRQANNRDIRRAFKKLALKMHPDKNLDDPEASDKFVRLNRAYEVLKDEDLRRKYDQFGEEGLDENNQGRNYENWQYYNQEFGLYDDDPEIITLSRSDFDPSVTYSEDVWFINFYSPRCSHCHTLAPAWREMAKQLDGVIRIGAVNCADERQLCQMQGVHGYPTLIIYPDTQQYRRSLAFHSGFFKQPTVDNFGWFIPVALLVGDNKARGSITSGIFSALDPIAAAVAAGGTQ